ncbi:hypothetical protein EYC80_008150 [Monilinia laxa]|uniref:Uncharacterized protein n=1 Tax=Monilinia laxa TaxID=61186 RepID=A0A5N6JTM4_MONLA|nr:hypothetical protein EYC80_008150 [Monilinia laxa]
MKAQVPEVGSRSSITPCPTTPYQWKGTLTHVGTLNLPDTESREVPSSISLASFRPRSISSLSSRSQEALHVLAMPAIRHGDLEYFAGYASSWRLSGYKAVQYCSVLFTRPDHHPKESSSNLNSITFSRILRFLPNIFGTIFIGFGINVLLRPSHALTFYRPFSLPTAAFDKALVAAFMTIYGARDIFMGLAMHAASYYRNYRTLGWILISGSGVAFVDGWVCYKAGGASRSLGFWIARAR